MRMQMGAFLACADAQGLVYTIIVILARHEHVHVCVRVRRMFSATMLLGIGISLKTYVFCLWLVFLILLHFCLA